MWFVKLWNARISGVLQHKFVFAIHGCAELEFFYPLTIWESNLLLTLYFSKVKTSTTANDSEIIIVRLYADWNLAEWKNSLSKKHFPSDGLAASHSSLCAATHVVASLVRKLDLHSWNEETCLWPTTIITDQISLLWTRHCYQCFLINKRLWSFQVFCVTTTDFMWGGGSWSICLTCILHLIGNRREVQFIDSEGIYTM